MKDSLFIFFLFIATLAFTPSLGDTGTCAYTTCSGPTSCSNCGTSYMSAADATECNNYCAFYTSCMEVYGGGSYIHTYGCTFTR